MNRVAVRKIVLASVQLVAPVQESLLSNDFGVRWNPKIEAEDLVLQTSHLLVAEK